MKSIEKAIAQAVAEAVAEAVGDEFREAWRDLIQRLEKLEDKFACDPEAHGSEAIGAGAAVKIADDWADAYYEKLTGGS